MRKEITVSQTTTNYFNLKLGTKFKTYDYEDKKWVNAHVGQVRGNGILVVCEDGLNWIETLEELSDSRSYKFNND